MCSGKKSLKWLAVKPFQHLAKVFLFGPSNKKIRGPAPAAHDIETLLYGHPHKMSHFLSPFTKVGQSVIGKKEKKSIQRGLSPGKARMQSREARILQGLAGTFRLFCALASLWLESEIIMLIRLVCIWFVV